ncbi:MAG: VCBS repeat-containing protein [Planctomycetota bacterium]
MGPLRSLFVLAALAPAVPAWSQLEFVDAAQAAGVDDATFGRGAAMVDLDGDGRLDLIAANAGMNNFFYRQLPDHSFQKANALWSVAPDARETWGVVAADLDNDGDLDVYFGNGGFIQVEPNQLLRNDIGTGGGLTDVSGAAGAAAQARQTFGVSALDDNVDGRLDLFASQTLYHDYDSCRLYRNLGELAFVDVSTAAGIVEQGSFRHTGAGDFDNDGLIDVGVGNGIGPNRLYRNAGDGTFQEVAKAVGVDHPDNNFGFVFQDLDNDGWLDVYLPKYQIVPTTESRLLRNAGDGTFVDVTAASGMTGQDDMGHEMADLDLDGFHELYIGTGNPYFENVDLMLRIRPAGPGFAVTDISASSGIASLGLTRSHGMAVGDVDDDGDVDVFLNTGGPDYIPDSIEDNALWLNQGTGASWVGVDLEGVLSNRDGVGARIAARTTIGTTAHAHQAAGHGFSNTSSRTVLLGLANAAALERVTVEWPSGIVQTLVAPAAGERHAVLETGLLLTDEPELGGSFALAACGPAGSDVATFYSGATLELALPPLQGLLQVGPPWFEGPAFDLSAQGTWSGQIAVADDPTLLGVTFHLQALVLPPAGSAPATLTNPLALSF